MQATHQAVAPGRFQLVEVMQHARQRGRLARLEFAGAHGRRTDFREWRDSAAIGALPERGVGNVVAVVRIERDADLAQRFTAVVDQPGEAQHVLMSAGDRQRGRAH
jgi:hypothetical protein